MSAKKEIVTQTAEETAAVGKKAEKVVQNMIYLGPSIAGVIRHSTVFKNGVLPAKVQECVKELPMMERLFVPIGNMPEAVMELKKNQSVLRTVYIQTAEKFI